LASEGVTFVTGVAVGAEGQPTLESLREENDAVVLASTAQARPAGPEPMMATVLPERT
jgi:glutamate synthase (NADPH/NADH)